MFSKLFLRKTPKFSSLAPIGARGLFVTRTYKLDVPTQDIDAYDSSVSS